MLLQKIKHDLKAAIITSDDDIKNALRMVLGEIPRLNKKAGEEITDKEVENIIRKLIKSEKIVLEYSNINEDDSPYIKILETYIPKLMTKGEVQSWIVDNINLSDFTPKIKAMSIIMRSLKGKVDGNIVKETLIEFGNL